LEELPKTTFVEEGRMALRESNPTSDSRLPIHEFNSFNDFEKAMVSRFNMREEREQVWCAEEGLS